MQYPTLQEKQFFFKVSTQAAHVHDKVFRYMCRQCTYGSDSRDYYLTHRVTKHNVKITSSKTKKPIVFRCKKCKVLNGPNLLKKHEKRGLCMTHKRYKCPECLKFYKTQAYLDVYFKQHHTPGANTWVCELCSKVCNSQSVAHNHQLGTGVQESCRGPRLHQNVVGRWRQ